MTHALRPWLLLALPLLLVAGCSPQIDEAPPVPSRTQTALRLLPANAHAVGMVDLQNLQQHTGFAFSAERGLSVHLLDSDLRVNPFSPELQQRLQAFVKATGFEPGHDLHAAYFAAGDSGRVHVLLAAALNRERLLDHVTTAFPDLADTTTYRGTPVLALRPPDEANDDPLWLALLDDGWMALARSRRALHADLDRMQQDRIQQAAANAPLQPLVDAVAGRGAAWFAARTLPDRHGLLQRANDGDISRLARTIQGAGGALNVEGEAVAGTLLLTTDQNPQDVADVIRGLLSGLKVSQDLTPEQRAALDRVEVIPTDGRVWVRFSLPEETLARLLIQRLRS